MRSVGKKRARPRPHSTSVRDEIFLNEGRSRPHAHKIQAIQYDIEGRDEKDTVRDSPSLFREFISLVDLRDAIHNRAISSD